MANSATITTPDSNWANRSEYWLKKINPVPQYKARKRRVIHRPLVLSGHGIRLSVNCGTLLIKCGFTHYPQEREQYRFFPQDRQLPSRIVILDGNGSISFDALDWLAAQDVPLVQIDWQGQVASVGGAAYAGNPILIQRQFAMANGTDGFTAAKYLIGEKIKQSCQTLKAFNGETPETHTILIKMQEQAAILKKSPPANISELLTLEGIAAAAYFRYWYTFSLKWRGINQKPIPQEWQTVGTRIGKNKSNQFAVHPVNAILNYAYGVLENQVRGHILTVGADPKLGFMHTRQRKSDALVYDLMEPVRPVMDKHVFNFVLNHTFSPDDFILNKQGICRLHPQFARYVVKQVQDIAEIENITIANLEKTLGLKRAGKK